MTDEERKTITAFWARTYVRGLHCSLCGNYGVIDTRGTRTPAGVECGDVHLCICPNGLDYRKLGANAEYLPHSRS